MEQPRVGKVAAVVIRNGSSGPEVLVFDHPLEEAGFMVQLPAGTIEPDEAPEAAAVRELFEETGVEVLTGALAGIRDEEWEGQARRRWVYLFDAPDNLPDEWPFNCDCGADTRCHWASLAAQIFEPQQPWLEMAKDLVSRREL